MKRKLTVDVWSDIACPWCYVGKRRLEAALAKFEHRDSVDVVWRAFELDPSAPRTRDASVSYAERLAKKYGTPIDKAESMIATMTETAAQDGLDFHFERIRPGNTFDAHRLLHWAGARGLQDALKERFLRAYMTEGEAIGEPEVLARLAGDVGLDVDEALGILTTDTYARDVREEEAEAATIGISGVPFFVFARRYAVSGAQPADVLLRVLERTWSEVANVDLEVTEGAVCGPDGCD